MPKMLVSQLIIAYWKQWRIDGLNGLCWCSMDGLSATVFSFIQMTEAILNLSKYFAKDEMTSARSLMVKFLFYHYVQCTQPALSCVCSLFGLFEEF